MKKPRHPKSPAGATFYASFGPIRPGKPQKMCHLRLPVADWTRTSLSSISSGDLAPLIDLAKGDIEFRLDIEGNSSGEYNDDVTVWITLYSNEELENPNYEGQMRDYKQDYEAYKAELAWWKECKKVQDEYDKAAKDERERKQYERLKAKFDT